MTKKLFSMVVTVCLVLTIAFAVNTKSEAAAKQGAYRANYSFNVYINGFDAYSSNVAYAYPTNIVGCVFAITVPSGATYVAGKDGYIKVYYGGGYYVKAYAPSLVSAGKMSKLY